jgi:pyruvate dehydrogenase (quinone)
MPSAWNAGRSLGCRDVEVPVHRRELAIPPTISLEQITGFGIFMIKAVLSGRGDEIVDLARTNLWR